MSKTKGNEDPEAPKKTGKAKGRSVEGGEQFMAASDSTNRDASLLSDEVVQRSNNDNSAATDNSFLYSADETYDAPKKKNKKKTRAKIQKSNDDADDDGGDNRERLNISQVSRSFDGFGESDWTEEEEDEDANDQQRDSLRRMGERLDAGGGGGGDAGVSSSALTGPGVDGAGRGKNAESKAPRAKVSLDKFGKLFRKFKKGNQATENDDGENVTITALSSSTNSGPGLETTAKHTPTSKGTYRHTPLAPQSTNAVRGAGGGGGGGGVEESQGMGDKERVMRERQMRINHRKICESVLVTVVLVLGFVLGIVLTSLSSLGLTFQIVGPTILGLSSFGLVGKAFVTIFWEEDPYKWAKGKFRRIASRHRRRSQKTTKAQGTTAAAAAAAAVEMRAFSPGQGLPETQGPSSSFRNSDDNSEF